MSFKAGMGIIQKEYRCVYVGGLGQENEKVVILREATLFVNNRICLMTWTCEQHGMPEML